MTARTVAVGAGVAPRRRASAVLALLGRRSATLVLAGVLCTNLAVMSLWSWRTFANSQGFADVVTDMLKEPAVRQEVATQIMTALEQQGATSQIAVNARPVLESVVEQNGTGVDRDL